MPLKAVSLDRNSMYIRVRSPNSALSAEKTTPMTERLLKLMELTGKLGIGLGVADDISPIHRGPRSGEEAFMV